MADPKFKGSSKLDLSATKWSTLLQCPARAEAKYVSRTLKEDTERNVPLRSGDLCHKALAGVTAVKIRMGGLAEPFTQQELFDAVNVEAEADPAIVAATHDLIRKFWNKVDVSRAVAVEQEFKVPLGSVGNPHGDGGQSHLWGFMDRVDRYPDGGILVVDYKTGYDMIDEEDGLVNPQVCAYLVAAHAMFPDAPWVRFRLDYIGRGLRVGPFDWTPDVDRWTRQAAWGAIIRYLHGKKWPERRNDYCGTCGIRDSCETYQQEVANPKGLATLAAKLTRLKEAQRRLKDYEAEKKALTREVKAVFQDTDVVFAGGLRGKLRVGSNQTIYDDARETVARATEAAEDPDLIWKVVAIDNTLVQEYLRGIGDKEQRTATERAFDLSARPNQYTWVKVDEVADPFATAEEEETAA